MMMRQMPKFQHSMHHDLVIFKAIIISAGTEIVKNPHESDLIREVTKFMVINRTTHSLEQVGQFDKYGQLSGSPCFFLL